MKLTRLSGKRGGERCQHEQPIPSSNDAGVLGSSRAALQARSPHCAANPEMHVSNLGKATLSPEATIQLACLGAGG